MKNSSAELSTILDRILDKAAENLRIAKIFAQLGLDPNSITYDALFDRLLEIVLANITLANMFALLGALFFVATLLTHTMVPLRIANMVGCSFFVAFGALSGNVATFFLYLLLLPINAFRLHQMLNLVKKARSATQGDTSMEWLKPFMTERKYRKGDVLVKKGDTANEMFLTITGKYLVTDIGVELPPGRLMGEFGFLAVDKRRTATCEMYRRRTGSDHNVRKTARDLLPKSAIWLLLPYSDQPAADGKHFSARSSGCAEQSHSTDCIRTRHRLSGGRRVKPKINVASEARY